MYKTKVNQHETNISPLVTGISTNTIDNNETSTDVTTQTICMYKTKVNQHETNISPLVKQKYITGKMETKRNMDQGISQSCGPASS